MKKISKKLFLISFIIVLVAPSVSGLMFSNIKRNRNYDIVLAYDKSDELSTLMAISTFDILDDTFDQNEGKLALWGIDNVDTLNSIQYVKTTILIYIFHGSEQGMQVGDKVISWSNLSQLIDNSEISDHYLFSCNSNNIDIKDQSKEVLGFNGQIDALIAQLIILKKLSSSLKLLNPKSIPKINYFVKQIMENYAEMFFIRMIAPINPMYIVEDPGDGGGGGGTPNYFSGATIPVGVDGVGIMNILEKIFNFYWVNFVDSYGVVFKCETYKDDLGLKTYDNEYDVNSATTLDGSFYTYKVGVKCEFGVKPFTATSDFYFRVFKKTTGELVIPTSLSLYGKFDKSFNFIVGTIGATFEAGLYLTITLATINNQLRVRYFVFTAKAWANANSKSIDLFGLTLWDVDFDFTAYVQLVVDFYYLYYYNNRYLSHYINAAIIPKGKINIFTVIGINFDFNWNAILFTGYFYF